MFDFDFSLFDLNFDYDPECNWKWFYMNIFEVYNRSLFKISIEVEKPFLTIAVSIFFIKFYRNFRLKK